jgi:hypothetical protein
MHEPDWRTEHLRGEHTYSPREYCAECIHVARSAGLASSREVGDGVVRGLHALLAKDQMTTPDFGLDSIEVVTMHDTIETGIVMQWHQHTRHFGLAAPLSRLIRQADGVEGLAFYLHLAIDEPATMALNGERLWYSGLPTQAGAE